MPGELFWLIFLLPLVAFVIVALITRTLLKDRPEIGGYISIAATAGSFLLSVWALFTVMGAEHHEVAVAPLEWLSVGNLNIHLGIMIDSLTTVMLIVITFVSLMVQIYSQGYMHGDDGYQRYFAFVSLFTTAMLGLVLTDNLFIAFVFWELVGLCSYLLIGFWFNRPAAANAAKKAFIVTRVGDFGFLAALLLLFAETGTLDIAELNGLAVAGVLAGGVLTWAALGIFFGAVGKSAQFPLHVWLPDAMEGPTPVSALIHAATMVAAGVFLVARTFPMFEHSETAMLTVAIIGGVTAIFAATMGLVMTDIKRVLAYSTISQLGYMMLGLGTGGVAVGVFHLVNHAFFKGLLFLGSGSVNHATGTFDMRKMGGLKKIMPWTYATFLVASLSMAGIWPLSGFWSKDEILASSLAEQPILFWLAMITVFLTAFYMFRIIFLTFGGEYRGSGHPHESPRNMVMPMVALGVLAAVSGLVNVTGGFGQFMGHGETKGFFEGLFGIFADPLPWFGLILAGAGIFLAYAMYSAKWISPLKIKRALSPIHTVLSRKYWMDELYEDVIVRLALMKGVFKGFQLFDSRIIDNGFNTMIVQRLVATRLFSSFNKFDNEKVDGAVNGVADGTIASGRAAKKLQNGQLQTYGMFIAAGVLTIALFIFFLG